ncbi:cupin domain-containing protein [Bradyrhizobium jicamae]|uniref:cupin domain-containing protein n=1 Tax=Bradyrhizobium jicamae TaxID=280332 RepID=UPI001BA78644|nr:cupin domain-containing protein [Bradyrhizobium jicamae]
MTSINRQQFLKWGGLLGLGAWLPAVASAQDRQPAPGGVRRIITGIDGNGRSLIAKDTAAPHVYRREGVVITELWSTDAAPSSNRGEADPTDSPLRLMPPKNGSVFRILTFLPQTAPEAASPATAAHADDSGISAALAKGKASGRAAGSHVTDTTDYVVMLSGEIYALVDSGEVLMKPGDVLVQRGTSHSWVNRSQQPASLAFVLIDAQPLS